jgi:outer membrane receptor protein involved in Fe transport
MRSSIHFLALGVFVCLAITARAAERGETDRSDRDAPSSASAGDAPVGTPSPAPSETPGVRPELTMPSGKEAVLSTVVVEARKPLSAASSEEMNEQDFNLRPHLTMQQVLNNVPGLVVAQHQGGGKATQWLIRGFDADHGTDIAVFLDDEPVNLPTHAHGQGYADTNFIIPDTLETLHLFKGPYFTQFGDFATAGAINFVTKDEVPENYVRVEGGSFDTQRYVAMLSPKLGDVKTLIAGQAYFTNGPFINPENYTRYNSFNKFTLNPTPTSVLRVQGDVYAGDWDGSGQIPKREVVSGQLDRFGSIDPTEGGHSDREDLNVHYENQITERDGVKLELYGARYKLRLWSDFTFFRDSGLRFIENPDGSITDTGDGPVIPGANYIPGDEIEQNDQRYLFGGRARYTRLWDLASVPVKSELAVEERTDLINVALWRSVRRNRFFAINKVHVDETSVGTWMQHEFLVRDWIRFETGLRGDIFFFHARNRLPAQPDDPNFDPVPISGSTTASIVSPKANLILTPIANTDVYMNFGTGFHSNDARNSLLGADSGFSPLARAIGAELGARTHQFDALDVSAALWWLDLDSELVFSGDSGNQETGAGGSFQPEGATRRWGIDFETRYRFNDWLTFDYDLAYADPRFRSSGDAIPLAPTLLMNGGFTAQFANGFGAALRGRYLGSRPASEDRSLTASGYFLLDLLANYRWRNVELYVQVLNLTDTNWREAQFADNTCVLGEVGNAVGCVAKPGKQDAHPVDPNADVHFTPGNPIGAFGGVRVFF